MWWLNDRHSWLWLRVMSAAAWLLTCGHTCRAGVYYVVYRLMQEDDGSVKWWSGPAYLITPGERPGAWEWANEFAREAAKEPGVLATNIVIEGENGPVVAEPAAATTQANTNDSPQVEEKPQETTPTSEEKPAVSTGPDDVLGRLNDRLERVANDLAETLQDVAESAGHDIKSVLERVRRFGEFLGGTVDDLNRENFAEIDNLVRDYNRLAGELGSGPLAESFADLKVLPALKPGVTLTSAQAREQILEVKSRLEETSLRLDQSDLDQSFEQLQVEAQEIATDEAAGVDVTERRQALEKKTEELSAKKEQFQQRVEQYDQDVAALEATRQEIKLEEQLEEFRRQQQAAELAERRRREAEAARPANPADQIVGTWTDRGTTWRFNSDGTFSGQARGTWRRTGNGVALRYAGATRSINLTLQDGRLVDTQGFIGGLRLRKVN